MPADLWFVMWRCGCTDVVEHRADATDTCPGHAAHLMDVDRCDPSSTPGHVCTEDSACSPRRRS